MFLFGSVMAVVAGGKRKGYAEARSSDGAVARAELHWYSRPRRELANVNFKIKRFL